MRIDDMTPQERETMRNLLLNCFKRMKRGLTMPSLAVILAANRFQLPPDDVELTLNYLVSKGWLEVKKAEASAANCVWTITAAGIDYLESQGL